MKTTRLPTTEEVKQRMRQDPEILEAIDMWVDCRRGGAHLVPADVELVARLDYKLTVHETEPVEIDQAEDVA